MRWRTQACVAVLVILTCRSALFAADAPAADAKKTALTPSQQDAVAKIQAKGGLVIPLAANSDSLVVSLATAGKQAGDSELDLVKQLPKVVQLDLRNTAVTDKGLASLQGMSSLESLHLEGTAVTESGLANLKNLSSLQYLNLFNTAVTDQGVANLAGLKNLKRVYLWETKVTDSGVAELKKSLPGVYVNHGEELAITTKPAEPIAEQKVAATPVAAAPAPAPKPVAPPATVAAAPKPTVAAPPEISLEQTIAEAKAAIDAQASSAKASIDAQAAAAKAAIDAKYLGAKSQAPAAAVKPINTKCPISGEAINPLRTVVFEGKVIGLCCEKCQAKFAADPKKYIDKVVADAR